MCQKRSIAGAHCLPANDLHGPGGELASFADIFWALGTAGISGRETILVTGERPGDRDFVAGLLYLCGQARVEILNTPIETVLRQGLRPTGQGRPRGILRHPVYDASMRDQLIVLPAELAHALANNRHVVPIDGRRLSASPLASVKDPATSPTRSQPVYYVAYAQSPMDSIALFTHLRASGTDQHVDIRVMPAAWRSGIAQPHRPISHNEMKQRIKTNSARNDHDTNSIYLAGVVMVCIAAMLIRIAAFKKGEKKWI